MALTFRRWTAIVVLVCATIAVWQLPRRGTNGSTSQNATQYRFVTGYGSVPRFGWPDAGTRLGLANARLRVLEIRDSVFTPSVIGHASPGLSVLVDQQIPDSLQRSLAEMLHREWNLYQPGARVPVIVAVVADTSTTNDGLPMANRQVSTQAYTFPNDSAVHACRIVMRIRVRFWISSPNVNRYVTRMVSDGLASRANGRMVLGSCALYATFGPPGPNIARWLARSEWLAVQDIDWTRPSPIWREDFSSSYDQGWGDIFGVMNAMWTERFSLSTDALACIAGVSARCSPGLLGGTPIIKDDSSWYATVIDNGRDKSYPWWVYSLNTSHGFGPAQGWVLSDMVRDLGRDRFEAFWESPLAPDSAFALATQQSLGSWLQIWARRTYGSDVLGPWIPREARLAGLVVVLIGLGVAVAFWRERSVI